MQQISIKNEQAVELLNDITKLTGKGKTEVVLEALKKYKQDIHYSPDVERTIENIKKIHATMPPELLGKAPTKEEIEEDLGMP